MSAKHFGNIFAEELSGLTDDQVVALCARHLASSLAALQAPAEVPQVGARREKESETGVSNASKKKLEQTKKTMKKKPGDDRAKLRSLEDSDDAPDDSDEEDLDSDAEEESANDDDDRQSVDDAMFKGGDLDEAEQQELMAMETEEGDEEDDEDGEDEDAGDDEDGEESDEGADDDNEDKDGGDEDADEDDEEEDARMLAKFEQEDLPYESLKFDDFLDKDKRPGDLPPDDPDADEAAEKAAAAAGPKSKFERSQERLRGEIAALEESLVRPAPWQLRGEVEAADRPEGGLLEEDLDFDHIGRPRPLASEDLEAQLLELVKSRVKEGLFDSVARKQRPEETPAEYRKALLLDTEKPRPLSEVYEREFTKQTEAAEARSQPRHEEIRRDLNSLLAKLDRLSGLHFAPQNPLPRVRVVSGAPALGMEEVRGTAEAAAEASQLAPEQVVDKAGRRAGREIGDSERSKTDRLRARRKSKARVRARLRQEAGRPPKDARAAALAQLKQQARKPGSRVRILAAT